VITQQHPVLLYTMPNFHNPTGITTSQAHREALLALCERHSLPLVEDGFEEEMKYFGKVALPIKSMDSGKVVIYLGTFSKILFPGLRIGFIMADAACIERLTAVKRFTDLSASNLAQIVLNDFCRRGCYERHIRRMHRAFRKRMKVALAAARDFLPAARVQWTEPSGGYLIWVTVAGRPADEQRLDEVCRRHGVVVSPGRYYYAGSAPQLQFRISISMLDEEQIREGFSRLGQALHAFCEHNIGGTDDVARTQV
jgi:DNA-binding transcriptional MocR family regulator